MARTAARSTAMAAHRSREGFSQTPVPKRVRFSLSPSSENVREEDPDPGSHTKLHHSAGDPHPTDGERGEDGSNAYLSLGDHTSRQAMPIADGTVSLGDEGIERCRGVHPKETKGEEGSAAPTPTSLGHPRPTMDVEADSTRSTVRAILEEFRSRHSIEKVREANSNSLPAFTVLELATGGCLDTIAAIVSGFRHLGGTEDVSRPLGRCKAKLFEDLAQARCLGDTKAWRSWLPCVTREVDYLKSGQPCPDYSFAGSQKGAGGNNGGELFVEQLEPIIALMPKVVRLEMVPSAYEVNGGFELNLVRETLSKHYFVHEKILDCWRYGDATVRKRLFIVALRRDLFTDVKWSWPETVFTDKFYPIARDIAVPDNDIPNSYRRTGKVITFLEVKPTAPGQLTSVGFAGNPDKPHEMGSSKNPPRVHSWDGGLATQLSSNGGSQRPLLEWTQGDPITETRLTVPLETLRAASLSEESYMKLAKKHFCRKTLGMSFDMWLRELVNLGVPVCTSSAIDRAVSDVLKQARVNPSDHCAELDHCTAFAALDQDRNDVPDNTLYPTDFGQAMLSKAVGLEPEVISDVGDSGATDHLIDSKYTSSLYDTVPATTSYLTAGEGVIEGDRQGKQDVSILNLDHQPQCPPSVDHTRSVTTIKGLGSGLWSLNAEFKDQGYDIHLCHGYNKGDFTGMYRPDTPEARRFGPESFIPMVYDTESGGGWRVPYLIRHPGTSDEQHEALLQAVLAQNEADRNPPHWARVAVSKHTYSLEEASALEKYYWACPAVSQTMTVRIPDERTIRPAFTYGGLRRYKNKNWHELHSDWAHMGEPGKPCVVCDMFKGAPRSMPKHTHGKPRETRPGHTWHMDLVHFKHRSDEGCKYLVILTDEATRFIQLIPLHWKSDFTAEMDRWVRALRSHPALQSLDYPIISHIFTDNESVWDEFSTEFNQWCEKIGGLLVEYGDPSDHARDNARAEGSNRIIEAGIKSLLFERNLPPSWWQKAANDVMFLVNRLPPYSMDAAVPIDGDVPAPITKLFHDYYSRNQVFRELDSYVSVGTPALCHLPKVKGSALEPKVRWGVAIGRRGKVTRWMCPFTGTVFRNRSFSAFGLRTGLNWSQFMGLGDIAPKAQSRMFQGAQALDDKLRVIELPAVRISALKLPPPVTQVVEGMDDGSVIRATCSSNGDSESDLCEYFPRIKQVRHPIPDEGAIAEEAIDLSSLEKQAGRLPDEGEDDQREIIPPREEAVEADTPGLRVTDARGKTVGTRPTMLPPPAVHPSDEDNLFVEGCDVSGLPSPPRAGDRGQMRSRGKRLATSNPPERKSTGPTPVKEGIMGRHQTPPHPSADPGASRGRMVPPPPRTPLPECDSDVEVDLIRSINFASEEEHEQVEADAVRKHTCVTTGSQSWSHVCKQMHNITRNLPFDHRDSYRLWLLTKPIRPGEREIHVEDLPKTLCEGRGYLRKGLALPYPSGPHWHRVLHDAEFRSGLEERLAPEDQAEESAFLAMKWYVRDIHSDITGLALLCRAVAAQQCSAQEMQGYLNSILSVEIEELGLTAYAARKLIRKPSKIVGAGEEPPPKNIVEALMGDRAEEWVESIYSEFKGLCDQKVFSHDWTLKDLREAGIKGKPIPCSTALTHKYKDGLLTRLKTRICIAGHKGNVTRGIHYHEVFSPSPVQHSERLLQAMMVNYHLHNLAWDIKQAYTWAPLPKGERVAVIYPDGFKRTNDEGEELFLVLEANLYGMPSASRGWGKHRDEFILERFNAEGWSCSRCRMDPCIFVIDKFTGTVQKQPPPPETLSHDCSIPDGVHRSWVLIHTDDCDAYGTSLEVLHEINSIMNKRWATELVDRSFILGVKRDLVTNDPKGWYVTLTMISFIENLADLFREHLDRKFGKRRVRTPFPEHLILTKADKPREGEVDRNITR